MLTEKQKTKIKELVLTNYNNQGRLEIIALYDGCEVEASDFYKLEMLRYCVGKMLPKRAIEEILNTLSFEEGKDAMRYVFDKNKAAFCQAEITITGFIVEMAGKKIIEIENKNAVKK